MEYGRLIHKGKAARAEKGRRRLFFTGLMIIAFLICFTACSLQVKNEDTKADAAEERTESQEADRTAGTEDKTANADTADKEDTAEDLGSFENGQTEDTPGTEDTAGTEETPETEDTSGTEDTAAAMGKDYTDMTAEEIDAQFYIKEIDDEIFARIYGKSYKEDCTLPLTDLRYLHLLHKDLDGSIHEGEMICNVYIAEDVLEIFRELYDADYPIEKVRLVDEYDASDELSMEDNNSSSFNFRYISHTTTISKHGLGLAVDINTLYNPYIKTVDGEISIEPSNAEAYVDRTKDFDYKIDEEDLAYRLFTEHGFEWGGSWKSAKDYQHFEIPDSVVKELYPDN